MEQTKETIDYIKWLTKMSTEEIIDSFTKYRREKENTSVLKKESDVGEYPWRIPQMK